MLDNPGLVVLCAAVRTLRDIHPHTAAAETSRGPLHIHFKHQMLCEVELETLAGNHNDVAIISYTSSLELGYIFPRVLFENRIYFEGSIAACLRRLCPFYECHNTTPYPQVWDVCKLDNLPEAAP